jgi:hypothetical protein
LNRDKGVRNKLTWVVILSSSLPSIHCSLYYHTFMLWKLQNEALTSAGKITNKAVVWLSIVRMQVRRRWLDRSKMRFVRLAGRVTGSQGVLEMDQMWT